MPLVPGRSAIAGPAQLTIPEGKFGVEQGGELPPQGEQALQEASQGEVVVVGLPVHPAQGIVLAPGVVVAPLAAPHLIPHQQHRHPRRQQQAGQKVADLPVAQGIHGRVAAGPLRAVVPAVVVVVAIAVVFAVGQVVLAVVAHQIGQGEAVVGGEEGDRAA